MTIRGCQVIPVYPLTEDIQPGDIYLVQWTVEQQQRLYNQRGYLPLDQHVGRLNPNGYAEFYAHSFFPKSSPPELLSDLVRPADKSHTWLAPHVAFPSYAFTVNNGAGLNLAVPVQGVPVGLSLLGSNAASGTVQIQDARTVGVDIVSLYQQVQEWSKLEKNHSLLQSLGTPADAKDRNYLRVVTRLYTTGRMTVSLKDASNRSGGVDAGAPKAVDLLTPALPDKTTNAATNYTNAWTALSTMLKDATSSLPGGSLRLAAASSNSVSLDETFDPPLTVGYLGFDCPIEEGGRVGPPVPTRANLEPAYSVLKFGKFKDAFAKATKANDTVEQDYAAASETKKTDIRTMAFYLGLTSDKMDDRQFTLTLRRAVTGDQDVAQKFQWLAAFAATKP